jgi:hypothetical protein
MVNDEDLMKRRTLTLLLASQAGLSPVLTAEPLLNRITQKLKNAKHITAVQNKQKWGEGVLD